MASSKVKSSKPKSSKGSTTSKKRKKSKPSLVAPDAWINELSRLDINDQKWHCSVALMEEQSTDATVYLEQFNESAINGRRLAIKSISKLEIIKTITENMIETNPGKEATPCSLLCSEIFETVGPTFEKKIPVEMLAPLIKYILLQYKVNNTKIREGISAIQKDQDEYHQSLWQINKGKSVSSKNTTKANSNSNKPVKSGHNKSKEKGFTKLRRRGEEWKDVSWIDDAPIDGPQLYVLISTLLEPDLPLALLNLNIPVESIIRLNLIKRPSITIVDHLFVEAIPVMLQSQFKSLAEFKRKSTQYLSSNVGKHIASEEIKKIQVNSFWNEINVLKNSTQTAHMFKNIMFLQFVPEHQNFEYKIQAFQDEIYTQVSYFLYSVFEIAQQHKAYLNDMEIIQVQDSKTCNLLDMFIYNSILDSIPQEVLNISLVLDALVAQVTGLTSEVNIGNKSNDQTVEKISLGLNSSSMYLFNLLDNLNSEYDLFDNFNMSTNSKSSETITPDRSDNISNLLIHGDDIGMKAFHLESGISEFVTNRTNHILRLAWQDSILSYFNYFYHDDSFTKLCNEIINVEQHTGQHGLYYYLYLLITNSILNSLILMHSESGTRMNSLRDDIAEYNRGDLCEECLLKLNSDLISITSNSEIPLSNSISCYSDGLSIYSLSDDVIATNLFYIEEMASNILLQRIQDVAPTFSNLVSRACPFNNQVVILFHNLVDPRTLEIVDNWTGKITTLVPVRDFVDYIIDEEEDWLKTRNNSFNVTSYERTGAFSTSLNEIALILTLMLQNLDFISHRSIKYETMMKQQSPKNSRKQSKDKGRSKSPSTKSIKSTLQNNHKDSKGQKDVKANQKLKDVNPPEEFIKKDLRFIGYDLGDPMRFQYNGWSKDIVLDDDCRIVLKSMKQIYGEESRSANINIFGNNLYINNIPNNAYDEHSENSFHLSLSSGIVLHFSSHYTNFDTMEQPSNTGTTLNPFDIDTLPMSKDLTVNEILNTEPCLEENVKPAYETFSNERLKSDSITYTINEVKYCANLFTYDLKMSTPSGLFTELVKNNDSLYIRQTLLTKGPLCKSVEQEKYRCFLPSGYIIKFMFNGDFEIFNANGEIHYIFNDNKNSAHDLNSIDNELVNNMRSFSSEKRYTSHEQSFKAYDIEDNSKPTEIRLGTRNRKTSKDPRKQNISKPLSIMLDDKILIQNNPSTTKASAEYSNYKFMGTDGKCVSVQNNCKEHLPSLFVSSVSDIQNNCINSERLDGVKSRHLADGSLMVDFPDGSRITSTPIESNQFFSLWTPEEFIEWFNTFEGPDLTVCDSKFSTASSAHQISNLKLSKIENKGDSIFDTELISLTEQRSRQLKDVLSKSNGTKSANSVAGKSLLSNVSRDSFPREQSNLHDDDTSTRNQNKVSKPDYNDDSFVVYNMSYLMEHPNYSTVMYDALSYEIKFELPMSTVITLKNDGSYTTSFEGANLVVNDNAIDFSRVEKDKTLRTITINISGPSKPDDHKLLPLTNLKHNKQHESSLNGMNNVHINTNLYNADKYGSFFLYSIDILENEIFIDYNFNCLEIPIEKIFNKTIKGNDFSCFVVNEDLSGFRLVSDSEVENHLQNVSKEQGIVVRRESKWSPLLSIVPIKINESEKWLMKYKLERLQLTRPEIKSTFGKRESWLQPFVDKEEKESNITQFDTLVMRLLHRIPTDQDTLNNLKSALEMFKKVSKSLETNKTVTHTTTKGDFNLTDLLTNPSLLIAIYEEEKARRAKEMDKFRSNIKDKFLSTLVHQACIKARKLRIKMKENEFKTALRNNEIPPYHLSCFGKVHGILDIVLENVTQSQRSISNTSIYKRVHCIIDEILSLAIKSESITSMCYSYQSESDSMRIRGIVDEIFQNAWSIEEENIQLNRILEIPLNLITNDDIEFLCRRFGSGSRECPILYNEDFILKDVLDARLQLFHYFDTLKDMLKFYRSQNIEL